MIGKLALSLVLCTFCGLTLAQPQVYNGRSAITMTTSRTIYANDANFIALQITSILGIQTSQLSMSRVSSSVVMVVITASSDATAKQLATLLVQQEARLKSSTSSLVVDVECSFNCNSPSPSPSPASPAPLQPPPTPPQSSTVVTGPATVVIVNPSPSEDFDSTRSKSMWWLVIVVGCPLLASVIALAVMIVLRNRRRALAGRHHPSAGNDRPVRLQDLYSTYHGDGSVELTHPAPLPTPASHDEAVKRFPPLPGLVDPTSGEPVEPPADFVCCITGEIMADPVCTADGHSYDRVGIERWFRNKRTSPKTGEVLPHTQLVPNHALRNQIYDWYERTKETLCALATGSPAGTPAPTAARSSSSQPVDVVVAPGATTASMVRVMVDGDQAIPVVQSVAPASPPQTMGVRESSYLQVSQPAAAAAVQSGTQFAPTIPVLR